jgi:hypothetical protein
VRVQGIEDTSELHCDVTSADDANLVKELKQLLLLLIIFISILKKK